jgi:hypothetical protein
MPRIEKTLDAIEVIATEGETILKKKQTMFAIDMANTLTNGTKPKIKKTMDIMDVIDVIDIITPQIDFLSDVLSFTDLELSGTSVRGLSSILNTISEQLQAAIREVQNDTDK